MEIDKEDRIQVEVELTECDLELFKELIYGEIGSVDWSYVSETGEAVDIKFIGG